MYNRYMKVQHTMWNFSIQREQPTFVYGINTNVNDQHKNASSMEKIQTRLSHVKARPLTQEQYNHIELLTQHTPQINNDPTFEHICKCERYD